LDGDLEFGPDAIGAGDEHRSLRIGGHAEHPAETAKLADDTLRVRGFHERFDAMLRVVRGVDVHARGAVAERRGFRLCAFGGASPCRLLAAGCRFFLWTH